ncbi:hypothetical protein TSAR_008312 [Trichomalopsis sarcophagae]|uniref:Uncharacterized protein n=1 Tax=Trichomalopsis sarcophagae TaxID=543379 RepID=A0A232FCE3_9HYME|nr:hypothetical protein TSAR_008312 [Trichomalopsis sarcophagae]
MTAFEKSLEPLKEVPRLMNRVAVVEDDIASLKAEQGDIKTKLDQLLLHANARIQTQLDSVVSSQAKISSELVITGLSFSDTTSLRHFAFAALKLLDVQLAESDILSVRPLGRGRGARNETNETDGRPDAGTGACSIPLAVSLSRTLMNSFIYAKIKLRKLHIKQLSDELLRKARVPLSLPDSFININECLPPDVYHLRAATKNAAKKHSCTTFVRDGRIYIKLRKEDRAVRITSEDDLQNFLHSNNAQRRTRPTPTQPNKN